MSGLSRVELSALDAQVTQAKLLEKISEHLYNMRIEMTNISQSLESIAVALEKR